MKHRINVTFDDETFDAISNIANRTNRSLSEVVRDFSIQGVNGVVGEKNLDLISSIMRTQLRAILKPDMERICALASKGTIMSATSAYLNAEALNQFVEPSRQKDLKATYDKAHNKAIEFVKNKVNLND